MGYIWYHMQQPHGKLQTTILYRSCPCVLLLSNSGLAWELVAVFREFLNLLTHQHSSLCHNILISTWTINICITIKNIVLHWPIITAPVIQHTCRQKCHCAACTVGFLDSHYYYHSFYGHCMDHREISIGNLGEKTVN